MKTRMISRHRWLLPALAVLWAMPSVEAQDLKPDLKQIIEELRTSTKEDDRINFLQKLGHLEPTSDCSLVPLFWQEVSLPGGKPLSLGLYRIDRTIQQTKIRASADVLSLLVGEDTAWLRTGPEKGTKWISLTEQAEVSPKDREQLFRSCTAQPPAASSDFLENPCQGRQNCESRLFLAPEQITIAGKEMYKLVPTRQILEQTPLGPQGVAQWLLARREGLYGTSSKESRLMSSHQLWKSQIWRSDQPDHPTSEHVFFPQGQATRDKEQIATSREIIKIPRLTRPAAAKNQSCVKILAPRTYAKKGDWGFTWSWKGLPKARALDLSQLTDAEGCLYPAPVRDFDVALFNKQISIQKLQEPALPVLASFNQEGPYTFILPGGDLFEGLLAANAFGVANSGLEAFKLVYSWIPDRIKKVKIYQVPSPDYACSAQRVPGKIYLPSACPGHDGFVAKSLCSDVVVHELAHEVMGSLVSLATGGQTQHVKDEIVDEALADFFAVLLRSDEIGPYYAPACQNDFFEITQGNSSFNESNFLTALLNVPDEETAKVVARLASLSTLYGYSSKDDFIESFFDFAEKSGLKEDVLVPICTSFSKNSGICDPRCPQSVDCLQVDGVEADQAGLRIFGTFNGTQDCPDFMITTGSGRSIFTPPPTVGKAPLRKIGSLGEFPLPPGLSPPFEILLKPNCAEDASVGESQKLPVSALPDVLLNQPADLEPLEVIVSGSTPASRRLIARYDNGQLWSYRKSKDSAKSLGQKLWPGLSVTRSGSLQGWSMEGYPITMWLSPNDGGWKTKIFKDDLPATETIPAGVANRFVRILQDDPRIEIVDVNSFEMTLRVWPDQGKPEIYRHSFAQEIDPESLEIGLTLAGPVLAVTDRSLASTHTYTWHANALQPTSDLAVFPTEQPALSFRKDGEEVGVAVLKPSLCKAPPYVRYVEQRLLALTCDGLFASYPIDERGFPREIPEPKDLGGILVPSPGARPIQLGHFDDHKAVPELILGPFRHINDGKTEDRVEIRDLDGNPFEMPRPIQSNKGFRGAPAILDLDHDGCDEVVTATDKLELWRAACSHPPS